MDININLLKQRLSDSITQPTQIKDQERAAVLVPLLQADDEWRMLFIRRAENASDLHSGQVAFPGGVLRSDEAPLRGALRETAEEIGVAPDDVKILGGLGMFQSITNYQVTAVAGLLPWPYAFTLQASEVSRVFSIPLVWLSDKKNYRVESSRDATRKKIYYREYKGEKLWGLSAVICQALLNHINA